jgi:hypothetical protein
LEIVTMTEDERDYPDAEARAKRRVKLFDTLGTFLDEFRESSEGGGWAEVTDDDMQELRSIFNEIIALKVGLDADRDQTIEFALCNRRKGRMTPLDQPYPPHFERGRVGDPEYTAEAAMTWLYEAQRNLGYAQAVVTSMTTEVESFTREVLQRTRAEREKGEYFVRLEADIQTLPYKEVFDRMTEATKRYSNDFDRFTPIKARVAERFPNELAEEAQDILNRMEPFTGDDEPGYYAVRSHRTQVGRVFGNALYAYPGMHEKLTAIEQEGKRRRNVRDAERKAK